jgi:hypothetical protein
LGSRNSSRMRSTLPHTQAMMPAAATASQARHEHLATTTAACR